MASISLSDPFFSFSLYRPGNVNQTRGVTSVQQFKSFNGMSTFNILVNNLANNVVRRMSALCYVLDYLSIQKMIPCK